MKTYSDTPIILQLFHMEKGTETNKQTKGTNTHAHKQTNKHKQELTYL